MAEISTQRTRTPLPHC